MTLTKKIGMSVAATLFVFLLLNLIVVNQLFNATFADYEDEDVARNTSRVMQSIAATYKRLNSQDWANWTENYHFLGGDNDAFIDENLQPGTIGNIGIDLMVLTTASGDIKWNRLESRETGAELPHDASFLPPYLLSPAVADTDLSNFGQTGILSTSQGLMLFAAQPVLRSDGSGPATGTMVMGRFIDDAWIQASIHSTSVNFLAHDVRTPEVPADIQHVISQIESTGRDVVLTKDNDLVHDYRLLRDIDGEAALLIDVTTPRDILSQGRQVQFIAAGSVLVAGLTILVVIIYILRILVTQPLNQLTDHIRFIKKTGEVRRITQVQARDEIGLLARKFVSLMKRQRAAEDKSRLLSSVIDRSARSMAFTDAAGRIQYTNSMFDAHVNKISCAATDLDLRQLFEAQGQESNDYDEMMETVSSGNSWSAQLAWTNEDGSSCEEHMLVGPVCGSHGELTNLTIFYQDVTERNAMERRLSQAEKLESIGQLAAGVAHEINTPTQFVGDNTQFLQESFKDLDELLGKLAEVTNDEQEFVPAAVIRTALEKADADYLRDEIPPAIEQSLDGIQRISNIVRAMKEFSHPSKERSAIDINKAIQSTVTVASNEWKYVAEMALDLASDMPVIDCDVGQLNQVVLNMIVNAAHALADSNDGGKGGLGKIAIRTSHADSWAEIRISDNGTGMPEDVRMRIFDPFFTTKKVGKGTGQGLSIAYDVIVNKHNGTIAVESEPGQGTAFTIRLPIAAQNDDVETVAATG